MTIKKSLPYILIIGSIIGFLASFVLTLDVIKLMANPDVELPCNLNPFISCTSVATSEQASVFGFPNSLLGITTRSSLPARFFGIVSVAIVPYCNILTAWENRKTNVSVFWRILNS